MTAISEIAPDVFRLLIYVAELDMQFNHFLVRDEEPLLCGCRHPMTLCHKAVFRQKDPAES